MNGTLYVQGEPIYRFQPCGHGWTPDGTPYPFFTLTCPTCRKVATKMEYVGSTFERDADLPCVHYTNRGEELCKLIIFLSATIFILYQMSFVLPVQWVWDATLQ